MNGVGKSMNLSKKSSVSFYNKYIKDYMHCWLFAAYLLFYLCVFSYVENRTGVFIHPIASKFDKLIPFCEYFIVPYYLWFLYIAIALVYFGFVSEEKGEAYRLIITLCIGMTLFLIISLVYPNGHNLRPTTFERDNIFVDLVRYLHKLDTPTNIFPSIHVFNSVAVASAIAKHPALKKRTILVHSSNLLAILIVCSTVFLKQHSIVDVVGALGLNTVCYRLIYVSKHQASSKRVPEILR